MPVGIGHDGLCTAAARRQRRWRGDLEAIARLVEGGADVNWRDSIGESALYGAAAAAHW